MIHILTFRCEDLPDWILDKVECIVDKCHECHGPVYLSKSFLDEMPGEQILALCSRCAKGRNLKINPPSELQAKKINEILGIKATRQALREMAVDILKSRQERD